MPPAANPSSDREALFNKMAEFIRDLNKDNSYWWQEVALDHERVPALVKELDACNSPSSPPDLPAPAAPSTSTNPPTATSASPPSPSPDTDRPEPATYDRSYQTALEASKEVELARDRPHTRRTSW